MRQARRAFHLAKCERYAMRKNALAVLPILILCCLVVAWWATKKPVTSDGPSDAVASLDISSAATAKEPVPAEWTEDLDSVVSGLGLSEQDALWLAVDRGDTLGLGQADRLRSSLDSICQSGKNSHLIAGVSLQRIQDALFGLCAGLLGASLPGTKREDGFKQYALSRVRNGDRLPQSIRAELIQKLTESGHTIAGDATDDELFALYCTNVGYNPGWAGIRIEPSRMSFCRTDKMPSEQIGMWAGKLQRNIRTYNPMFKSVLAPEEVLGQRGSITYADISLVVQRTGDWEDEVSQFFLRFWLDEDRDEWHLAQVSMVKRTPEHADATLFVF